jgi:hypothetical protein
MAAKKKAGKAKSKRAGKPSAKPLKDLSPKRGLKIKGGRNPKGAIDFF